MLQLNDILDENNEGIKQISKGNFKAAQKAFRTALLKLREFYNLRREQREASQFYSIIIEPRRIPHFSQKKSHSNSHYVYRNALLAYADPNPPKEPNQDCAGLTAMLVFNLSLVYHCIAEQTQLKSDYTKVLRTYRKSWDALQKDLQHHDAIAVGVLNNMGAIFHELANYRQAQRCFKALKRVVSLKRAGVLALQPDTRTGIILNVLFLEEPTTAVAA